MKVWIVVLGILIAAVVLFLAFGAVRYQAVVNERDELQQRLTFTEVTLEGKVGDIRVLQATLEDKNVQIGQLEVSEAGLREQLGALQIKHTSLLQEKATLEVTVLDLKTISLDLQERLVSKGKEYDALSSAVGTLEGVKSQISGLQLVVYSLNEAIERLQAERAPLIVESYRVGFKCTGSMEPKITCLDEATWLTNFRPQDITVGTVISFTTTAECRLSNNRVAHRVISIKVEAGTIYYLPKGDANSSDDGCWIPSSSINGYIITLYKNTKLENAPIRDRINGLKAAMDYALAVYDAAYQTYKQKRIQYCGSWTGECTLPTNQYDELTSLRGLYEQKYSQYIAAYDSYWAAMEIEKLRL